MPATIHGRGRMSEVTGQRSEVRGQKVGGGYGGGRRSRKRGADLVSAMKNRIEVGGCALRFCEVRPFRTTTQPNPTSLSIQNSRSSVMFIRTLSTWSTIVMCICLSPRAQVMAADDQKTEKPAKAAADEGGIAYGAIVSGCDPSLLS